MERLRIVLSFLLAALVLGAGGVILHRSSRRTQDVGAEVGRTRSEIIALQALLATIEDAETGQRGYLLTGDQAYLTPYRQATALIESELYGLEGFQKGDRLLQANFLPLQRHIHVKLSELRQTIGLAKTTIPQVHEKWCWKAPW